MAKGPPTDSIDAAMDANRLVALAQYALDHHGFRHRAARKKDFQTELKKEYSKADYDKFTSEEIAVCIGFADTVARRFPFDDARLRECLQHIIDYPPASG